MRIIEEQNILQELFERFILFEESASYNENCNRFHIHRLQLLFILTSTFFCNYVLSSNKMLRVSTYINNFSRHFHTPGKC